MIHLITRGGMGNQMFEYAYALHLMEQTGQEEILLNGAAQSHASDHRELALQHFNLPKHTRLATKSESLILTLRSFWSVFRAAGMRNFLTFLKHKGELPGQEEQLFEKGLYITKQSHFWPTPARTRNAHIFGFFQSTKAAEVMRSQLSNIFTVVTPPSPANAAILEEIRTCNAVCLHIRRGDYQQFPQLQVCNYDYYKKAVEQACKQLETPVFYIFSTGHEDIEWVRKNYHFDAELRYVDLDNPDYEEIRLMMNCKHFIISNSTFSWWAAVLSTQAPDKTVWAPQVWLHGSRNQLNLDSWNIL